MLLTADRLIAPGAGIDDGPGWVRVDGSIIVDVGAGDPGGRVPDAHAAVITAGFVDTHVHGAGGATFSTDDPEEAEHAARTHWRLGSTTLFGSLVTAGIDALERQVRTLASLCERDLLAGIHLEGPWLSAEFPGAHDPALLVDPDPADIDRLIDAGEGHVRMVTLAPELPGGMDAVRHIASRGVTAALGHSAADATTAAAAIDAGVTVATHLCNAMPPIHHRSPGPVPVLLADPRVTVEMIGDGVHIDPRVVRLGFDGSEHRLMFVSDAMSATSLADGDYVLGELPVRVTAGVARIVDTGAIAGSTSPLAAALTETAPSGLSLADRVRALTETPAETHDISDVGAIAIGKRADLVLLDDGLGVCRVLRSGVFVGS